MKHPKSHTHLWQLLMLGWLIWGGTRSQPYFRDILIYGQINQQPVEQRDLFAYGSDFALYQDLVANTDSQSTIGMIMPDTLYQPRANYFLFPRTIHFISDPKHLTSADLKAFDYLAVYISKRPDNGIMQGMNRNQTKFNWTEETFYELHKTISAGSATSREDFKNLVESNKGWLWYELP